jgi:hypothetical protein
MGHFPECFSADPDVFPAACFNTLGPIHTISGLFGVPCFMSYSKITLFTVASIPTQKKRIVIQDSRALAHLIKNAYDYPKPDVLRGEIGRGIGHGLLYEEG